MLLHFLHSMIRLYPFSLKITLVSRVSLSIILQKAEQICSRADFVLSLGTTMQVTPACDLVLMGKEPLHLAIVNRQKTNFDYLCIRKDGKEQLGVRAFGDCDAVLREVMRQLLVNKDRVEWERGRMERLKVYGSQRKTE